MAASTGSLLRAVLRLLICVLPVGPLRMAASSSRCTIQLCCFLRFLYFGLPAVLLFRGGLLTLRMSSRRILRLLRRRARVFLHPWMRLKWL